MKKMNPKVGWIDPFFSGSEKKISMEGGGFTNSPFRSRDLIIEIMIDN